MRDLIWGLWVLAVLVEAVRNGQTARVEIERVRLGLDPRPAPDQGIRRYALLRTVGLATLTILGPLLAQVFGEFVIPVLVASGLFAGTVGSLLVAVRLYRAAGQLEQAGQRGGGLR